MIEHIRLDEIHEGDNDRTVFDAAEIRELSLSIRAHGLLQPISVRPNTDGYEIIAGERRYRACHYLEWVTMPAIVHIGLSDEDASALMLAENVSRKDLDPMDEAKAYHKRIGEYEWSIATCADKAGVSADRVRKRLRLLDLRPDIQHLVAKGQMPVGHAEAMAKLDSNRQTLASRPLVRGEKINLREFQSIVDALYAEQTQEAMFDLSLLNEPQSIIEHGATVMTFDYPIATDLPTLSGQTTGEALVNFIKHLTSIDKEDEAKIAGWILYQLAKQNLTRIPYEAMTKLPLDQVGTL